MSPVSSSDAEAARRRRHTGQQITDRLRDLRNQLSLLNHQVGSRLGIKDVDLDCLDLIARHGPCSPGALAQHAGLHPATMTGVLDRLQRAGWITRARDPDAADRRAVSVRAVADRAGEIFRMYAGMQQSLNDLYADYTDAELAVLADFLDRATRAGRAATTNLANPT